MVKASDYGFFPGNTPEENSIALQRAADFGGDIYVDGIGIADVCEPVRLGSYTSLYFSSGLTLRRQISPHDPDNGYVFINKGAFTGETDTDIRITGLHLSCNGVISGSNFEFTENTIPGLRGHLSFFRIRNLIIDGFETLDLPPEDFAIHICSFENITVQNVHVEGKKDAVHLGSGNKFVIRHGLFRTFDDPIALNAHDYSISNPELGWIEDGLIEDCYDMNDNDTVGFFCRILAGSWSDWKKGMKVQNSDTVVHNNRLYRVFMNPDKTVYTSFTPPEHEKGTVEYDGIKWVMVQEGNIHNCGCRRIHFRDIHLQKNRCTAFSLHFDKDEWSRSVYPNTEVPVQSDIVFENIYINAYVPELISSRTPINKIHIINSVLDSTKIVLNDIDTEGIEYDRTDIIYDGCTFRGNPEQTLVSATGKCSAKIRAYKSTVETDKKVPFTPKVEGNIIIDDNDIGIEKTDILLK